MTTLIQYHKETKNLALFETDGLYWIGSYFPFATHQTAEPDYLKIGFESKDINYMIDILSAISPKDYP